MTLLDTSGYEVHERFYDLKSMQKLCNVRSVRLDVKKKLCERMKARTVTCGTEVLGLRKKRQI